MTDERRRALEALLASLEAACEVVDEPWGTIVTSPEFHRIHMANLLWLRRLPTGGLREALARVEEVLGPYRVPDRQMFVEDTALADALRPELEAVGYARKSEHLMFARNLPTLAANPDVALRPARDSATWDDHDAVAGLLHEEDGYDHEVSFQLLTLHRRRQRVLGSEVFVAYLDGVAVGNVGLDGIGGVGELYEVETAPAFRKRGIAATMVLAILDRARARGLWPLFLRTTVGHSTFEMYEKLGFVREGTLEGFLRPASAGSVAV
ncbi:MAG: GNAT family N-acetyltransferase [Methanobacteriota archaeon]|nr:MAG: GNAT family N-acetyltransferase [Euryarchaeota archaeon]